MAIVQASLVEDILSRQERAVLRGIYRATQLNEAMIALQKISSRDQSAADSSLTANSSEMIKATNQLKAYIAKAIESALVNTKVPASSVIDKTSSIAQQAQ